MRISDWISDVCSSDLVAHIGGIVVFTAREVGIFARIGIAVEVLHRLLQHCWIETDLRRERRDRRCLLDIALLHPRFWAERLRLDHSQTIFADRFRVADLPDPGYTLLERRLAEILIVEALVDEAFAVAGIDHDRPGAVAVECRSEEHTSELQSLMRNSYAVFC